MAALVLLEAPLVKRVGDVSRFWPFQGGFRDGNE